MTVEELRKEMDKTFKEARSGDLSAEEVIEKIAKSVDLVIKIRLMEKS